jgi:competence protein ComEC
LWRLALTAAAGVLAATVCAEVVLTPIGASLFSRVTFAGLALNLAAIPLMTAVQCGSMLLLAVAWIHPGSAGAAGTFVHHAATGLVETSRLVAFAPWLARDVPPPAWWLCVAYYALCLAWLVMPRRPVVLAVLAGAGLLIITGAAPAENGAPPGAGPGVLRLVVLDVGQGDATIAILPDGTSILVDAGGLAGTAYDIGGRVVVPALRALGVRRLHALLVTHGDPDHLGGAEAVLAAVPVANVWEGVPVPPHPGLRRLVSAAGARRVVWRTLLPGDTERAGSVQIRVLHPPSPDWERQRVRNDDSVVIEIRHGDVSIVLPGDIGSDVERRLIPQLDLGPVVVLKAAHHGSATSSSESFIQALSPKVAIFSAGRNNRFGHPVPVVVDRFRRHGVEMFNTATDGAVFVETDGKSVEVHGWNNGRRTRVPVTYGEKGTQPD